MSGKIATVLFAALVTAAGLVPQTSEAGPRGRQAKAFSPGARAVAVIAKRGHRRRITRDLINPVPTTSGVALITPAVQAAQDYVPPEYPCPNPKAHAPGC